MCKHIVTVFDKLFLQSLQCLLYVINLMRKMSAPSLIKNNTVLMKFGKVVLKMSMFYVVYCNGKDILYL